MIARPAAAVGFVLAVAAGAAACGRAAPAGPRQLTASSKDFIVRGEYSPVTLDHVDALKVEHGRLVLKGAPADVVVDLPAAADAEHPARHWALVTDAHVDRHRLVIFTEAEAVKDVSIELPDGEAPIHFDVFAGRDGGEVLVFATGDRQVGPLSLYGYAAIKPR
jgi:hypothetical protein